ncbi:apolipoprotein N-acyltransferase [Amnibacterium sp. CER49]|uniref:apolipoprotein N-acyltransferase n=1 Tax=Amnibacterium sp. CER49 TaxID=3039161 RepID=UPI0024484A7C|nr:apolipoprotein N-acyltransferase [Amnibacterium sp. CER49]MDH2444646.1 apolipoprotein N-acyltransferase [Amnibacterium sp. CER49]
MSVDVLPERAVRETVSASGPVPATARFTAPLPVALLLAALGGGLTALAFPAPNVWLLVFPGVGLQLAALRGRGLWTGALVGFAAGLTFWFSLISWITLFLGAVPLLALGTFEALNMAAGGGLIALAYRSVPLLWRSRWGRVGVTPLVVALAWTCREVVASTWPYGGFAWGRLALSQSTSPFAPLAAWTGLTGLSFVLAWLTAFGLAVLVEPSGRFGALHRRSLDLWLPRAAAIAVAFGLVLAVPPFRPTEQGVLRVAAVQPNTHAGYFDPRNDPSKNLDATVQATVPVLGRGAELVVWPEGASEGDPFADPSIRTRFDSVASLAQAPLLAGAITVRDGVYRNSSILWRAGEGIVGLYDKVHPVPFAEYVPDRAFWTPFAPDLLKLIGRDYAIGTRSPVLDVGRARIGVDICFDIADDGLILGSVADGAQLLVGQTNNADFGTTEENQQQLAIARLRAIETGRSVVTVSTVASTTIIAPDGATIDAAKPFTRAALLDAVPLATGTTPAVAFGIGLGIVLAVLGGVLPLLLAALARPLRRR